MMRKLGVCFVILTLTAVAAAQAGGAAPAPSTPASVPVKVGIINIQAAIAFSNEGQRDFTALQKKFEPKQAEIAALSKELEDLKKQAQAQANVASADAQAAMARNIEQKQKQLQRTAEDAQGDFRAQYNELASKIGNKMMGVLEKYAKDNGFAVVLNNDDQNPQNPILCCASVDITRPVMEAYNVASGVPAPPPPAPSAAKPATGAGTQPARPSASNPPAKPATNPPR